MKSKYIEESNKIQRSYRKQRNLIKKTLKPMRKTPCNVGLKHIFLDNTISNRKAAVRACRDCFSTHQHKKLLSIEVSFRE